MEIIELLKQDHRKVEQLFQQLETKQESIEAKDQLFSQLKQELDVHTQVEETIFYPELKAHQETQEMVQEALQEHEVIKTLLYELSNVSKGFEQWSAKLKVLKEQVEHHVKEEEQELFPQSSNVLGHEKVEELGRIMKNQRQEILSQYARFRQVS